MTLTKKLKRFLLNGEKMVEIKYNVFIRESEPSKKYYLGSGSLRVGKNKASSISVTDLYKKKMLIWEIESGV